MIRVAFTDVTFEDTSTIHLDGCEFTLYGPLRSPDEIVAAAREADVLCMRDQYSRLTGDVVERLPQLKLIVTRSAGYDHIDMTAAAERGIPVCNVPDYGAHMIAEMAFGLLLAVARNIVRGDERYRHERRFSDEGLKGVELLGKTLGIIGTGRIGLYSARIAKGFGLRVIANDVVENTAAGREFGFQYVPLEQLLAESDFVTLHVRLNDTTRHLINAERLAMMNQGAILVNTSRGPVVDTAALVDALRSGHLLGAGLDVLEGEREIYQDFAGLNVVVTPHLGWYTGGAVSRILAVTLQDIEAFLKGALINRVG